MYILGSDICPLFQQELDDICISLSYGVPKSYLTLPISRLYTGYLVAQEDLYQAFFSAAHSIYK